MSCTTCNGQSASAAAAQALAERNRQQQLAIANELWAKVKRGERLTPDERKALTAIRDNAQMEYHLQAALYAKFKKDGGIPGVKASPNAKATAYSKYSAGYLATNDPADPKAGFYGGASMGAEMKAEVKAGAWNASVTEYAQKSERTDSAKGAPDDNQGARAGVKVEVGQKVGIREVPKIDKIVPAPVLDKLDAMGSSAGWAAGVDVSSKHTVARAKAFVETPGSVAGEKVEWGIEGAARASGNAFAREAAGRALERDNRNASYERMGLRPPGG